MPKLEWESGATTLAGGAGPANNSNYVRRFDTEFSFYFFFDPVRVVPDRIGGGCRCPLGGSQAPPRWREGRGPPATRTQNSGISLSRANKQMRGACVWAGDSCMCWLLGATLHVVTCWCCERGARLQQGPDSGSSFSAESPGLSLEGGNGRGSSSPPSARIL